MLPESVRQFSKVADPAVPVENTGALPSSIYEFVKARVAKPGSRGGKFIITPKGNIKYLTGSQATGKNSKKKEPFVLSKKEMAAFNALPDDEPLPKRADGDPILPGNRRYPEVNKGKPLVVKERNGTGHERRKIEVLQKKASSFRVDFRPKDSKSAIKAMIGNNSRMKNKLADLAVTNARSNIEYLSSGPIARQEGYNKAETGDISSKISWGGHFTKQEQKAIKGHGYQYHSTYPNNFGSKENDAKVHVGLNMRALAKDFQSHYPKAFAARLALHEKIAKKIRAEHVARDKEHRARMKKLKAAQTVETPDISK